MISTLINLLGSFYESNDLTKAEAIARNIHTAIPGDQVSLKFLGLVYYRTGRINDAIRLFDQVQCRHEVGLLDVAQEKSETKSSPVDSAVSACSREAARRVPYLAQAWHELGKALLKLRKFERSSQSLHVTLIATPALT